MSIPEGSVTEFCFVTKSIETAVAYWSETVGAGPFVLMEFEPRSGNRYRGGPATDAFRAAIGFLGTTLIELLQPADTEPSIIHEVLETGGEGALHHIYPHIAPLDATAFDTKCRAYREAGYEEALSLTLPGMGRNSFFDARHTLGCFLEVLEFDSVAYEAFTTQLYQLHRNWDGADPLRAVATLQSG